ncbi:MAG: hypothetical protein HC846_02645 [Blastocatellia bacterium]|nr:hypothetical protein [Blastocatellia bacterium]
MYNLPAVSEGSQAIAIDPITLPQGYLLADNNSRSGKGWTRLLRTPLGGGAMLRQNFVLVASTENPPVSNGLSDDDDAKKIEKKPAETEKKETAETKADEAKIVKADFAKDEKKEEKPTEFRPVTAGEVLLHDVAENQLVMSPALNLNVSVAKTWKAAVELNGQKISEQNIGTTREDPKNQITTYTFIGLGLKPGPNR